MKNVANNPIVRFLVKKKRYIVGLLIVALIISLFYFFPAMEIQKNPSIPPVVSVVGRLEVVSVSPVGDTKSLDTLYPVAIEFNQPLGADLSGINIAVFPNIPFRTYTTVSTPKTLWLEPSTVSNRETQGWADRVEYTITVMKGLKSSDGATLGGNYTFKIRNSTQDIYMRAD